MFIGRERELTELNSKYQETTGNLVLVYGKRRLGKTAFLREFTKDKSCHFYVCRETIDSEQIKLFSREILEGSPMKEYIETFDSWEKAFLFLMHSSENEKKLVVIDEFPYMGSGNKEILSILQNVWDEHSNKSNLMCVLTGSSLAYIEDEILSEKSPLYGRMSSIIKLNALSFKESAKILDGIPLKDQIAYYSILGGVPRYLKLIDKEISVKENIKKHFLNTFSILYQEIDFLMKEILREPSTYYAILSSIAAGDRKIRDIAETTKLDKTKINVYIKNLIGLNIIHRKVPLLLPDEKANQHRSMYYFNDPYFEFYFHFIFPHLSLLETQAGDEVMENYISPYLDEYIGEHFKQILLEYLKEENSKGNLNTKYSQLGSTWNEEIALPIFGYSKESHCLFGQGIYNGEPTLKDVDNLKQQSALYMGKTSKDSHYYLFTLTSPSKEMENLEKLDNTLSIVNLNNFGN